MSESDSLSAFSTSKQIADSWFAIQALASVVRYAPNHTAKSALKTIHEKLPECRDDYCRGAVLSWPIRALIERGEPDGAKALLSKALEYARISQPVGSRAEALFLLYQASFPLGHGIIQPILDNLFDLALHQPHWRCLRAFAHAMAIHSKIDPVAFNTTVKKISDPKLVSRVNRDISQGYTRPREFFYKR